LNPKTLETKKESDFSKENEMEPLASPVAGTLGLNTIAPHLFETKKFENGSIDKAMISSTIAAFIDR